MGGWRERILADISGRNGLRGDRLSPLSPECVVWTVRRLPGSKEERWHERKHGHARDGLVLQW
jgi:hypothetical protein